MTEQTPDQEDLLADLPSIALGDCTKCGAPRHGNGHWTACNIDDAGNVTDCNRCEERRQ